MDLETNANVWRLKDCLENNKSTTTQGTNSQIHITIRLTVAKVKSITLVSDIPSHHADVLKRRRDVRGFAVEREEGSGIW